LSYDLDYWVHKSVRDPLYGFIHISRRESALIDTPLMHRLTRVKQLAHSFLVYPSAVHTRFEHSLGILHIADRMCNCYRIEGERREIIRAAALLHDVGHGPFSHLFEEVLVKINGKDFSHELVTKAIIENDEQISGILKGALANDKGGKLSNIHAKVVSIFDKEPGDIVAKSIISSQLDADKMDYLRRDSYHTGSTYGNFDLERILATLRLDAEVPGKEIPVILEKGIPALETFRLARYSLYTQVVQHHARLIADQMFLRAFELAIFKENHIDPALFQFNGKEKDFVKNLMSYDDFSIYELILDKCKNDTTSFAFSLMNDLKNRRLFKRCFEKDVDDISVTRLMELEKDPSAAEKVEQEIASKAGIPPELVIVHLQSEAPGLKGYKSLRAAMKSEEFPFLYKGSDGKIRSAEDRFSIMAKSEAPEKLYVFSAAKFKSNLDQICKTMLL
jgi:uncharacterized protein